MRRKMQVWLDILVVMSLLALCACGGGAISVPSVGVVGVAFNPNTVPAGLSATGTVTLSGPAPSGGATVTLSSGNAAVSVPGSVNISAGGTTANFQATTSSVNAMTAVTITATLNGSAIGTLTVNLVAAAGLTFSPNFVTGGQTSTGTVTLSTPAPSGGATVMLSSGNAAVRVPGSVNISAGGTTANFQATTSLVNAGTPVTITGTFNGSLTGILTLDPASSGVVINLALGTTRFQTFEAWEATALGPTFTDANNNQVTLSQTTLNQVVAAMDDLGLNGFRIVQGASNLNPPVFDFSAVTPMVQSIVIPLKTRVEARGEIFSTYVSLGANATNFATMTGGNSTTVYKTFVSQFQTFFLNNFGFEPTYWVVVNEPTNNGLSGSFLSPFVDAAAAQLASTNSPTKVQTLETSVPDELGLVDALFLVTVTPADAKQIGVYSFHSYDDDTVTPPLNNLQRNMIRTLAKMNGVKTASTEICCISGWNGSYPQALGISRDIYWNLTEADVSIWQQLAIMFPCQKQPLGCPQGWWDPITLDPHDFTKFYLFAAYYGWRQWAHYIRPGYVRVDLTCQNCTNTPAPGVGPNVKPVAFRSPAGKIVMVVVNDEMTTNTISISGLPVGTYNINGVDPLSTNPTLATARTYSSQTVTGTGTLLIDLPAQAIVTFVQQ